MKTIVILGIGCMKCEMLYQHAKQAADELGIVYQIKKVTDLKEVASYGVMMTPALVVDGEVKLSGRVLSAEGIKELLR